MAKYRKKPIVVDAFHWRADGTQMYPGWLLDCLKNGRVKSCKNTEVIQLYDGKESVPHIVDMWLEIETLEGRMRADVGDYIIRGIRGEIYPCKPDIFEATYEIVKHDND